MKKPSVIILISFISILYGQDISDLETAFRTFKYDEVLLISAELLNSGQPRSQEEYFEILRMKATAHYTLGQVDSAAFCFAGIVSVDENYQLNPVENSPKIIALFNQTRMEYQKNKALKQIQAEAEKEQKEDIIPAANEIQNFKGALLRSMVLPGWGHYYTEQKKKGAVLGITSLVVLSSSIYLIYETNRLEQKYLNELDQEEMDNKYEDYNQAYRIRNISLTAYAVLWLYAQIDLSAQAFYEKKLPDNTEIHSYIGPDGTCLVTFTYRF